jgi:hypothetical protein
MPPAASTAIATATSQPFTRIAIMRTILRRLARADASVPANSPTIHT